MLADADEEIRALAQEQLAEAKDELPELEEQLRLEMLERDPADDKDVIVEVRAGTGGDEAALFAGDLFQMLTRYAENRGFKTEVLTAKRRRRGRVQGARLRDPRRRRLLRVQVRERSAPRAARSRHRVAGPHPHLDRHRRRAARGRGGRPRDQSERPADRRLPLGRTRRPVRQYDRLRRAHHPRAERHRRHVPGRALAASEQGAGDEDPARPPVRGRARARAAGGVAAAPAQIGSGERSEKIRTYNFPQNRVTDHRIGLTVHNLDGVLAGSLQDFTEALAAEDRRRKLADASA